jgi:hypothetical protein
VAFLPDEASREREFRETGSRLSRSVSDDACSDYETLMEAGKPKDWAAACCRSVALSGMSGALPSYRAITPAER